MRVALSCLIALVFAPTYSGSSRLDLPRGAGVRAVPVTLVPGQPMRRQVGGLQFLAGIELVERGRGIGGYSALRVDGDRFTLLSDGGNILSFRWRGGTDLTEARYRSLPAGPGRGWQKQDRDSESMAADPASGDIWVGFERENEIWRYDRTLRRAIAHAKPLAMAEWRENGGAESLARMPDGGVVVISETTKPTGAKKGRAALYFTADPATQPARGFRFTYNPPRGTDPTDAAALPDGRLLVLHRRLSLPFHFTSTIAMVPRGAIRPGASVSGQPIATLASPMLNDNFEGLAITQERGRTIVWLVSDNNQFFMQRTLLLKFALSE